MNLVIGRGNSSHLIASIFSLNMRQRLDKMKMGQVSETQKGREEKKTGLKFSFWRLGQAAY